VPRLHAGLSSPRQSYSWAATEASGSSFRYWTFAANTVEQTIQVPFSRGIGRFRTPQLRIVVIGRSGRPAREPWHNQTKDGDSYVARTRIPLCSKGICATVTYRVVLTSREKLQRSGTCVRISDAKGRRSIRRRGQALRTFPVGLGLRRWPLWRVNYNDTGAKNYTWQTS